MYLKSSAMLFVLVGLFKPDALFLLPHPIFY